MVVYTDVYIEISILSYYILRKDYLQVKEEMPIFSIPIKQISTELDEKLK